MSSQQTALPLVISGLSVSFGAVSALRHVDFEVAPRTIHAVIGPNGAGKSTLLNVLSGVYKSRTGSVTFGGTELLGRSPRAITELGIARAFQNIALSSDATVMENIMLGRHRLMSCGFFSTGLAMPWARREERIHEERALEIADYLELGSHLDLAVSELSYGDQKRVEIARALAMEPRLLLLDEPVAGMNSGEKRHLTSLIRQVVESLDLSIVLVEHDMEMVMSLCDRVTVLEFGTQIADGIPSEIQNSQRVIDAYLGTAHLEQED